MVTGIAEEAQGSRIAFVDIIGGSSAVEEDSGVVSSKVMVLSNKAVGLSICFKDTNDNCPSHFFLNLIIINPSDFRKKLGSGEDLLWYVFFLTVVVVVNTQFADETDLLERNPSPVDNFLWHFN